MNRGVNKVILIGNLGDNPDFRTSGEVSICRIRVATSDRRRDRESGELVDKTEWHRVVAFGRTAEVMRDYLRKGSSVYIEGRLQTQKWQDNQGADRYTTEVIANQMTMLDSRSKGTADAEAPIHNNGGKAPSGGEPSEPSLEGDLNDDIPF